MNVQCPTCHVWYDDELFASGCPHGKLPDPNQKREPVKPPVPVTFDNSEHKRRT